jgi:nitrogen fixation protein FixH
MSPNRIDKRTREVTGRTVLLSLIAFFAVVVAVNLVMLRAATSTFGGLETASSYRAGLQFGHELAAASAQDHLRWRVDGRVARNTAGEAAIEVSVHDARGGAPLGLVLEATLDHPTDARRDRHLTLTQVRPGLFRGAIAAAAGQWDFIIDILRDNGRVFRSKSRLILR